MTQHRPAPNDRQHPTQHRIDVANAGLDPEARQGPSSWWLGLLGLLPIACCVGLPLLVAAGATAGSGAIVGGIAGAVLMLAGAAGLGIWGMRRRARNIHRSNSSTATNPPREGCC